MEPETVMSPTNFGLNPYMLHLQNYNNILPPPPNSDLFLIHTTHNDNPRLQDKYIQLQVPSITTHVSIAVKSTAKRYTFSTLHNRYTPYALCDITPYW